MHSRIPVVVVTGLPGSGKTMLIERLLRGEPPGASAVIARAQGSAPASALFRLGGGFDAAPEGACPCCSLSGELAGALRDLFMAALRRSMPAPRRVLVETAGAADPASILYSLHHDPFLRERYFYRGCITAVGLSRRLDAIGLRQAVLADALVLGPASASEEEQRRALRSLLEEINPLAPCFDADRLPGLADILARGDALAAASMQATAGAAEAGTLWSGARGGRLGAPRGVAVLRLAGRCELSRPQFLRAMDELQEVSGAHLLRIAAILRLRGEAGAWELRGVHRQLYWQAAVSPAPVAAPAPATDAPAVAAITAAGTAGAAVEAAVEAAVGTADGAAVGAAVEAAVEAATEAATEAAAGATSEAAAGAAIGTTVEATAGVTPMAATGSGADASEDQSTMLVVLEASAEAEFRRRAQALLAGLHAVTPAPRMPA